MKVKVQPGKVKTFGLIRDKDGKPRIDDINNIAKPIWDMLTDKEQQEIKDGTNTYNSNS